MQGNPVGWFEIYVEDMDRARAFYEAVFGYPLTKLHSSPLDYWSFPHAPGEPGAGGGLVKLEGVKPDGGGSLVYFHTEDCAIPEARVVAAGGQVHRPKFAIGPHGFISHCSDTEGNMFGLHSMK